MIVVPSSDPIVAANWEIMEGRKVLPGARLHWLTEQTRKAQRGGQRMVFRTLSGVASVAVATATMRPTTASVLVRSRHDKKSFFLVFFNLG